MKNIKDLALRDCYGKCIACKNLEKKNRFKNGQGYCLGRNFWIDLFDNCKPSAFRLSYNEDRSLTLKEMKYYLSLAGYKFHIATSIITYLIFNSCESKTDEYITVLKSLNNFRNSILENNQMFKSYLEEYDFEGIQIANVIISEDMEYITFLYDTYLYPMYLLICQGDYFDALNLFIALHNTLFIKYNITPMNIPLSESDNIKKRKKKSNSVI